MTRTYDPFGRVAHPFLSSADSGAPSFVLFTKGGNASNAINDGSYSFSNPQTLNRYAYALNNPLAFRDPSGLICDGTAKGDAARSTGGAKAADDGGDTGCVDAGPGGDGGGGGGGGWGDYGGGYGDGGGGDTSNGNYTFFVNSQLGCNGPYDPRCMSGGDLLCLLSPGSCTGSGLQFRASASGGATHKADKRCSVLDPNCKPPSYPRFLACMAFYWPVNLLAGETGGVDFKNLGLGTLAGVAIKFRNAPIGAVSAALVSISVLSAEKDANETCTAQIYGK